MAESANAWVSYEAARNSLAVLHRTDRRFLGVTGRAPGEMLLGILTSGLPEATEAEAPFSRGSVVYSAILDAKGKMISDLRVFNDGSGGFVLDIPEVGLDGVTSHFGKYLPPRLAKTADLSQDMQLLTVAGPDASTSIVNTVLAGEATPEVVEGLGEGEELVLQSRALGEVRVVRNGDLNAPVLDLILPPESLAEVQNRLFDAGALSLLPSVLEILRIEKGRPAFGVDMDHTIIAVEAGIHTRAVDEGKGCYIGQEVVIRIRDRGHVNKQLRGLLLGDSPTPTKGEELFLPGKEKAVGWITSACHSPSFGQAIALGYVRRGVEPEATVRVGSEDGEPALIRALGDDGWI
jgi:folate-binding protein YgfZ